jgi:hypothetical protein
MGVGGEPARDSFIRPLTPRTAGGPVCGAAISPHARGSGRHSRVSGRDGDVVDLDLMDQALEEIIPGVGSADDVQRGRIRQHRAVRHLRQHHPAVEILKKFQQSVMMGLSPSRGDP